MSRLAPLVLALALGLVWVLPTSALAQRSEGGSAAPEQLNAELQERIRWWQRLSPEERKALRNRYQQFQQMRPGQQQQMRDRVKRWRQLPTHERQRMRERHRAFRSLPAEEQTRIHQNYERWQNLPPGEKKQMRKRFEQFRSLPKAERERLRKRVRELDPEKRKRFLRRAEELRRQRPQLPTDVRPSVEPGKPAPPGPIQLHKDTLQPKSKISK